MKMILEANLRACKMTALEMYTKNNCIWDGRRGKGLVALHTIVLLLLPILTTLHEASLGIMDCMGEDCMYLNPGRRIVCYISFATRGLPPRCGRRTCHLCMAYSN